MSNPPPPSEVEELVSPVIWRWRVDGSDWVYTANKPERIIMVEGDTIVCDSYVEPLYSASSLHSLSLRAQKLEEAVLEEREACAQIVMRNSKIPEARGHIERIAHAIRARSAQGRQDENADH